MKQRRFNKAFVTAAKEQYISGKISHDNYQKCLKAAANPDIMKKAYKRLMEEVRNRLTEEGLCGIRDWDWEAILKWLKENFIPAMKIILPMLLLLDTNASVAQSEEL